MSFLDAQIPCVGGRARLTALFLWQRQLQRVFFFFWGCRLYIHCVWAGRGEEANGGVGCGCLFSWQMESFYSLLAFSHWMTSLLSHKAKRSSKSVSRNTKPSVMSFYEQISAQKSQVFWKIVSPDSEQVIFAVCMIWKNQPAGYEGHYWSADLLQIIVCSVLRGTDLSLVEWPVALCNGSWKDHLPC